MRGLPGKEKKRIKSKPDRKPSEKSCMRAHFKRLAGMIWMHGSHSYRSAK